ncbi:MAG TPA: CdaR family protein [Thermomicrobiales bacterium]|nr:CdaR family protein [Thermomicrobiales bacterium]
MRVLPPGRSLMGISGDAVFRAAASLALAFLLWAWVTTQRDPPETRVFADLALQAPTLPEPLQIAGELPPVTIEVIGPRSVVDRLSRAGLRPSLDMSEVTGPGNYQAEVVVDLRGAAARIDSITPQVVPLVVDETTSRTMHLEVAPAQIDDPTRRIGEIVPEVSEVTVSGPKRLVDNVAQVVLPVDIGDRSDNFTADFVPTALDAAGQPIPEVALLPSRVTTTVEVDQRGRSVPVLVQAVGSPEQGYESVGSVANPATVLLDGPEDVLANILSVVTAPVNIDGATETVSTRVGLEDLPPDVRVVNPADGSVVAVVQIRPRGVTQLLSDLPVQVNGVPDGFTASVEPDRVGVVVFASEETMASLGGDEISASVSAEGLGAGRHQVRPSVTVPPEVQWLRTDPEVVVVTVEREATGVPATRPAQRTAPEATPQG